MEMMLRRMGRNDITVHGFRSTFRDWAAEQTSFPREIAELSLAHLVGNAVERAYRPSDLLEKRRELLTAWADFCGSACAPSVTGAIPDTEPGPAAPPMDRAAAFRYFLGRQRRTKRKSPRRRTRV
jgi:hypothetical protein